MLNSNNGTVRGVWLRLDDACASPLPHCGPVCGRSWRHRRLRGPEPVAGRHGIAFCESPDEVPTRSLYTVKTSQRAAGCAVSLPVSTLRPRREILPLCDARAPLQETWPTKESQKSDLPVASNKPQAADGAWKQVGNQQLEPNGRVRALGVHRLLLWLTLTQR